MERGEGQIERSVLPKFDITVRGDRWKGGGQQVSNIRRAKALEYGQYRRVGEMDHGVTAEPSINRGQRVGNDVHFQECDPGKALAVRTYQFADDIAARHSESRRETGHASSSCNRRRERREAT